MTQKIIDNAGAISFDRSTSIATTVSQGRNLKFFRQGPIQSRLVVNMNVVTQDVWRDIRADLADSLVGPYDIQLNESIIGPANSQTLTVNGASQTDNTINISATSVSTQVLDKGDIIRFDGVDGSYMVLSDVTTDSDGDATVTLDFPVESSPADNAEITVNSGITFSMHLIERATAQQVPGSQGHVGFDGSFIFVEEFS